MHVNNLKIVFAIRYGINTKDTKYTKKCRSLMPFKVGY
jgi:hypothetical protein